jgi:hypothetical protein
MQENEQTSDKNKTKHCNRVSTEKHRQEQAYNYTVVNSICTLSKVNIYKNVQYTSVANWPNFRPPKDKETVENRTCAVATSLSHNFRKRRHAQDGQLTG